MIKELILAIILGGLLGFGITGGYLAVKKDKTKTDPPQIENQKPSGTLTETSITPTASSTPQVTPEEKNTSKHQVTIDSPENETVSSNSLITLKGLTSPNSTIVITTTSKNYTTTSDKAGNFSQEIEIDSGANLIQITSIDLEDNQATSQLLVTYSTAKF